MYKTIGIVLLSVYIIVLGIFATAEYFYQEGLIHNDVGMLKTAVALNPLISQYRSEVFQKSKPKDISSIKEAIRIEPLRASYHMYYALELLRDYSKRTRQSDQIAFHELQRAYQLKPYSANYRQIYNQIAKPYLKY